MPTEYRILRSKMLEFITNRQEGDFTLHSELKGYFQGQSIELDDDDLRTVEQIIHEFYIEGILVPGFKPKANLTMQGGTLVFPRYHLTEYGEKVVSTAEYQPHDPDGYLARIKGEIPEIEDVIIRYLEEGLSCFRRNLVQCKY
ncbi:hypothetical protein ACFL3Q_04450 [Planctomycetota bacterium]